MSRSHTTKTQMCHHTFLSFPLIPLTIVIYKRLFLTIQEFSYFYEALNFKSRITFIILRNTSENLVFLPIINLVTLQVGQGMQRRLVVLLMNNVLEGIEKCPIGSTILKYAKTD